MTKSYPSNSYKPTTAVNYYPASSADPSTTWIVTVVIAAIVGLLFCIVILWCVLAACSTRRANRRRYFHAKETDPSLKYRVWKQREHATRLASMKPERARRGLQEAEGKFERVRETRAAVPEKRRGVFRGWFVRKRTESEHVGSANLEGSSVGRKVEEDEERLVGGEPQLGGIQMQRPARAMTWGSETPPAYSSIAAEDHDHEHEYEVDSYGDVGYGK